MKKLLNWKVGFCDSNNTLPKEFYEATVPGAVQLDYAKHYGLAYYRKGLNFRIINGWRTSIRYTTENRGSLNY